MECIPWAKACLRRLIDVADGRLIDEQGRGAAAVDLDAIAVIPLDNALHLFAVFHYHHHGCFTLDLLLVVVFSACVCSGGPLRRMPDGARSVRSSRSRRSETGSVGELESSMRAG